MGLPWPFAGAGLAVLPKPGAWMNWVKRGFAVFILVMAGYYAHLGYSLFSYRMPNTDGTEKAADTAVVSMGNFEKALQQALENKQSIFIDFWATWCKNCLAMDATTFKSAEVQQALSKFMVVKYQAEFPNQSPAKDVLDYFEAIGLPTYIVLTPR